MHFKVIVHYVRYSHIHWALLSVDMKNSEKLEIRGYIKVRCGLGISASSILNEVHEHFRINSVSKCTVYRWFWATFCIAECGWKCIVPVSFRYTKAGLI